MRTFKKFIEMTFSAGKQDFHADPDASGAEVVGKFNGFEIKQSKNYFFILSKNELVGWIKTSDSPYGEVIDAIRISPQYRRQHLAENFLFWIKSYLKKSIVFGDAMSDDAILWLKGLSNSGRFKIFWLNIKTGVRHPYNSEKDSRAIQPYRSQLEPTDWRIFVEAYNGNFFINKYHEWNSLGAITDLFEKET